MTTTPGNTSSNLPGKPPVVDLSTWQAAREELLVHEKAHTVRATAIAAARRRLPMVELDGAVEVTGVDGPVPFLDVFQGRDELVVYHSMWYDGAPPQGQCEGCTFNLWHMRDPCLPERPGRLVRRLDLGHVGRGGSLRRVHGVHPALVLGAGRGGAALSQKRGTSSVTSATATTRVPHLLHDGPRQRAGRRVLGAARHDSVRSPRGVGGQNPEGWPEAADAGSPVGGHGTPICWYWRTDADGVATWGPTGRPTPQWTRPGATPVKALGRKGPPHLTRPLSESVLHRHSGHGAELVEDHRRADEREEEQPNRGIGAPKVREVRCPPDRGPRDPDEARDLRPDVGALRFQHARRPPPTCRSGSRPGTQRGTRRPTSPRPSRRKAGPHGEDVAHDGRGGGCVRPWVTGDEQPDHARRRALDDVGDQYDDAPTRAEHLDRVADGARIPGFQASRRLISPHVATQATTPADGIVPRR